MFHSLPLPRRSDSSAARWRSSDSNNVRTGMALASAGVIFAIATVWFEEQRQLDFAVGLMLGIAAMPWVMTTLPSLWKMLPQPGAISAIAVGVGTYIGLVGLYGGRWIAFGIGTTIVLAALTVWITATHRD